tara:strand:- start:1744 stop:2868 length:1125 start_codon:yes stop_codon:yes gene_type:complete
MKKHILNRPMFRQVKSPAYGTGISANLVSNEERQRYNYGGRVGLYRGSGIGYNPDMYLPSDSDKIGRRNIYEHGNIADYLPTIPIGEFVVDQEDFQEREWNPKIKTPPKKRGWEDREAPGGEHPLYGKYEDVTEEEVISPSKTMAMKQKELSGEIDSSPDAKFLRTQNTTDIDVDPFAYLEKSIEEKKKLAKGNALMKAAAAAVKWGGAPTAEKRAAAISEGLTGFGDEASKATAAAMDLKDRAKILSTIQSQKDKSARDIQELKGEQTEAIWDKRIAAVKRDPNKTDLQRFQELMDLPGGQTGQGIAKALRAVLDGKQGVADSVDVNDTKQLAKIKNGTIVVSLEGRVGIKDDSKVGTGGIDWSVSVEEILEG